MAIAKLFALHANAIEYQENPLKSAIISKNNCSQKSHWSHLCYCKWVWAENKFIKRYIRKCSTLKTPVFRKKKTEVVKELDTCLNPVIFKRANHEM